MALAGFLTTRYLLARLGAERLGALRAAQQWTGFLTHFHFGLGAAVGVLLLEAVTQRAGDRVRGLLKTGLKMLFRQSLFIVPLNLVLAWYMPVLVPVSPHLGNELRLGSLIGVAVLLISPLDLFRATLECLQLGSLVNLATAGQSIAIAGLAVLLAYLGYELPGQFVAVASEAWCRTYCLGRSSR